MKHSQKSLLAFVTALSLSIGICPAYALSPPPDESGYTQGTQAGGTVSTDVSLTLPSSGGPGADDGSSEDGQGGAGGNQDYSDKDQYEYKIYYHYGNSLQRDFGYGFEGARIPYSLETPVSYAGSNWILDSFDAAEYITNNEGDNVCDIYYTKDDVDKDGNQVSGGDGIADKYQDPDGLISALEGIGYSVTYNYKDEENQELEGTETYMGVASVGSAIPYSTSAVRKFQAKDYAFSNLSRHGNACFEVVLR